MIPSAPRDASAFAHSTRNGRRKKGRTFNEQIVEQLSTLEVALMSKINLLEAQLAFFAGTVSNLSWLLPSSGQFAHDNVRHVPQTVAETSRHIGVIAGHEPDLEPAPMLPTESPHSTSEHLPFQACPLPGDAYYEIGRELEELSAVLRHKLYNMKDDRLLIEPTDPDSEVKDVDFNVSMDILQIPSPGSDGNVSEDLDTMFAGDALDRSLDASRRSIAKSLFCIEDWTIWTKRGYNDEDASSAVEDRFEHGRMNRTANGWTYTEDSDDDSERGDELEVSWMGHLFVFDRIQFRTILSAAPVDAVVALSDLDSLIPTVAEQTRWSRVDFEHLSPAEAYQWQEFVPDGEDHDSMLLSLLKAIRHFIQQQGVREESC